jgi:hypothetical protein
MKTLLMAASALSLLAAPAFAQDANVDLTASVAEKCSSLAAFSTTIALGELPIDADGYLIGNGGFEDIAGGDLNDLTNDATVWCNTAATVTVAGTPLVHESLSDVNDSNRSYADGFMRHIDLRIAGFSFGGVSFGNDLNSGNLLDNASGSLSESSTGAFAGPVTGQAQLWTGDYLYLQGPQRPLGGGYRAEWTFTVTPNS